MNISLDSIVNTIMSKGSDYLDLPSTKELKNINWESITDIFQGIGLAIIIILLSSIVLYLFKNIGLYVMAKNENEKTAFLTFVPYGFLYVLGKTVGKTKLFGIEIEYPEYLLPALLISMFLPFACVISNIIFIICLYGLLYRLYEKKSASFSTVLLILSIVFPPLIPFFIFALRNK